MQTAVIKQAILIVSTCSLCSFPLYAKEFPRLYKSAAYLGRGDTGIANAKGEEALFYNPAGLSEGKGIYQEFVAASPMLESSQSTRDVIREVGLQEGSPVDTLLKQQGVPQHVGLNVFSGLLLRRAAIGAFASNSTTLLLSKDPNAGGMQRVSGDATANAGIVFGLAQGFWKNHSVGMTAKYVQRTQAAVEVNAVDANKVAELDSDSLAMAGTGTGIDLGYSYRIRSRWNDFAFGLTINDVGNTAYTPNEPTEIAPSERALKDMPQTVNMGIELAPGTNLSRFKLLMDVRDLLGATKESDFKKIHIGSELAVGGIMGAAAGLNQGYPTFGLYADTKIIRVDIGSYGEEVGERAGERGDQRFYFRIKVGL